MDGSKTEHWHAFDYVGHEKPRDSERIQPSSNTPPLIIANWLDKGQFAKEKFPNTEIGRKEAAEWVKAKGVEQVPQDADGFSVDSRMVYVEDDLSRGADVVWGYYSQRKRFVSVALIACPREGKRCPKP